VLPLQFEIEAKKNPSALAAVDERGEMTYARLDERSNRLANYLLSRGLGRGSLAAVCCTRSLDLLAGLIGVLKTGAAFLPIEATCPARRRDFMLHDSGANFLLTQERLAIDLPSSLERLFLDRELQGSSALAPRVNIDADDLAYVLYTSGSTGQPKGVEVTHRGLSNYLENSCRRLENCGTGGAPAHLPAAFDAGLTSLFSPLLAGRTVHLLPDDAGVEGLARMLQSGGEFTVVKLTPSHLDALDQILPPGLRLAVGAFVVGGEALLARHVTICRKRAPGARIFNEYGLTETSVGSTVYEVPPGRVPAVIPIGRPIANTSVYVLDDRGQPAAAGELYIGGDGVARGYRNRPKLTEERFVPNPFGPGRLFRTGDQVRVLPGGELLYLGRFDQQVKVCGYRIELGEIEGVLAEHPAVQACAVVVCGASMPRLVAHLVCREQAAADPTDLREFLSARLPAYMVPSEFRVVPALPLTNSGKVDRKALQAAPPKPAVKRGRSPRNNLELQLLRIWESVLGVRPIGVEDDFFALGGHSLMALRLIAKIEKATGRRITPDMISRAPTVEKLAKLLAEGRGGMGGCLVPIQPEGSRPPLFCVHGIGGSILGYGHLARCLPDDQPLYGLQARGLDGREQPCTSIEEMAAEYIRAIRTVQPQGPYHLGGYSFGGIVAFEMARQLEAAGEPVASLLLLDSALDGLENARQDAKPGRALARRVALHGGNLLRLGPRDGARYVAGLWRTLRRKMGNRWWQTRYRLYEWRGVPVPQSFRNVKEAAYFAVRRYVPRPYSGSAVLFRAEYQPGGGSDPTLGWGRWIEGGVTVHTAPGDHMTLTVGENAVVLAREMSDVLAAAGGL
jgi:amino acid adenylation domain-containing protein